MRPERPGSAPCSAASRVGSGFSDIVQVTRANAYLMRWARKKYRRLQARRKAQQAWQGVVNRHLWFFAHCAWVPKRPHCLVDQDDKSRMNREVHVQICGSRRGDSLRLPAHHRPRQPAPSERRRVDHVSQRDRKLVVRACPIRQEALPWRVVVG